MMSEKIQLTACEMQVQVKDFLHDVKSLVKSGTIDAHKAEVLLSSVEND